MSVGAVVACCALAAACTQEPAQTSSPSPTPLATTPRESQIERQMRLDYEAAEEAYRANIAEQDRQAQQVALSQQRLQSKPRRRATICVCRLRSLAIIRDAGWQAHGEHEDHRRRESRLAGEHVRPDQLRRQSAVYDS